MSATQTADFLLRLRKGILDPADTAMLEQIHADDLVDELRLTGFRVAFQERRIGRKWEIALARSLRTELAMRSVPEAVFVSFAIVPVYVNCVMLNSEDNSLTGISRLSRLSVRTVRDPRGGLRKFGAWLQTRSNTGRLGRQTHAQAAGKIVGRVPAPARLAFRSSSEIHSGPVSTSALGLSDLWLLVWPPLREEMAQHGPDSRRVYPVTEVLAHAIFPPLHEGDRVKDDGTLVRANGAGVDRHLHVADVGTIANRFRNKPGEFAVLDRLGHDFSRTAQAAKDFARHPDPAGSAERGTCRQTASHSARGRQKSSAKRQHAIPGAGGPGHPATDKHREQRAYQTREAGHHAGADKLPPDLAVNQSADQEDGEHLGARPSARGRGTMADWPRLPGMTARSQARPINRSAAPSRTSASMANPAR